ncbi:MAG TPA: O-antigen ligase family protein [Acidimicrobiia bacterium]
MQVGTVLDAAPWRRPFVRPGLFTVGVAVIAAAIFLVGPFWTLLVAIAVPTTYAVYKRPQRGILILAAALPFDGILKQFGPGWTNPWKQVLILGILLATFICPKEARAQVRRRLPGWVPAFAVLLLLGLVSAAFVDLTTALVGLRLSYFSILLAIAIWRCPLDRRDRDQLVTVFVAMGFVTAVIGLWQQVVGYVYLNNLGYQYDTTIRFTDGLTLRSFSTFNLPFPFAYYLMLVVLIGLPFALAEPKRLRSRLFLLSLPVLAVAMFFTFVRGAMLGLAIGLLYLAFHRYKILVYGIPLVLVAALFIPSGAVLTNAAFSNTSLQARTTSWSQRFHDFESHPFGSGIGTTGAAAEKVALEKNTDPNATYVPDSSWLKVMFELGVIGVWFFVAMLISMFLSTRSTERRVHGIDVDFVVAVSAQLLAIMTASFVATYLELVPMDQLFWIMIAIVATMAPELPPRPAIEPHRDDITAPT